MKTPMSARKTTTYSIVTSFPTYTRVIEGDGVERPDVPAFALPADTPIDGIH